MTKPLDEFDFSLPEALIAQTPASPRDSARLLVYERSRGTITDAVFRDIGTYLPDNTTLVVNNTKVDKCRLRFGALEVFVLGSVNDRTVRALIRPGHKFKLGKKVALSGDIAAEVTAVGDDGVRTLTFNCSIDDPRLDQFRLTPLPPYIAQDEDLADEYQTVYASQPGSRAAPTAGLHFTDELLEQIGKQHDIAQITLDVGLGTFAPIRDEQIAAGVLHREHYVINTATADILNRASHITAVGTTCVRTLETAALPDKGQRTFQAQSGATDIFIQPGYKFKATDAMVTNFHLPKTSLLMLVAAFMGYEEMMRCYRHAIEQEYRFYSFGDAMLIL